MKKVIAVVVLAAGTLFSANAQDKMMKKDDMAKDSHKTMMKNDKMSKDGVKIIELEQTPGEFTEKQITVKEGTYVFEVSNNNVGHDVGFVLVKKGEDVSNPENHIKTAYVTEKVHTGEKQHSMPTKLEKGEYVYFCPLNPTSTDNTIVVE